MPNGNVHRAITKTLLLTSLPIFFYTDPLVATGIEAGIWLGLWVHPDNDITINRLGIYKYLGFNAYNQLTTHRSGLRWSSWKNFTWKDTWKLLFYSHVPVTGTLLRLAIILYIPLLLLLLISALQIWMAWVIIGIFVGQCYNDSVHSMADLIWSALKKIFPFLKRYDDNGFRPFTRGSGRQAYRPKGRSYLRRLP